MLHQVNYCADLMMSSITVPEDLCRGIECGGGQAPSPSAIEAQPLYTAPGDSAIRFRGQSYLNTCAVVSSAVAARPITVVVRAKPRR
jgi:hypothetical protein